jgi:hypothetical protein
MRIPMKATLTTLAGAVLLAACSTTIPEDFSFSSNSTESVLVLKSGGNTYPTFKRVDLDIQQFEDFEISPGPEGASWQAAQDVLTVDRVPAGTYAMTKLSIQGQGVSVTCFSKGAPVYELPAGTVVSFDPTTFSPGVDRRYIRAARPQELSDFVSSLPAVTAETKTVGPIASVSFESRSIVGVACPAGNDLQVHSTPL